MKWVKVDCTNWLQEPVPTGPIITVGTGVFFKFDVTNDGDVELTNITLWDDYFGDLSSYLPSTVLPAGQSFTVESRISIFMRSRGSIPIQLPLPVTTVDRLTVMKTKLISSPSE